jgi:citrate lyase subunit beta/citryl-CoA lyase
MSDAPTRLRSVLFMPGDNERALEKAKEIPADALILDFEDAVAPGSKDRARQHVCRAVASGAYGERLLAIRVNSAGSAWHDDDLRAVAAAGPDAVVVPKVGSASEVLEIEAALVAAGAPERTRIWAMLESPPAVLAAQQIAAASSRLTVLVMGTNDLAKELYADHVPGREPLLTSLSLCLLGARAGGKAILDGVYNDLRDPQGFEAECAQGRRLGFDGKTLVHPGQVEICNRVFSPSDAELQHARRVVEAFETAARAGAGVATVDGRLVENMHVESARRVLSAGHGAR